MGGNHSKSLESKQQVHRESQEMPKKALSAYLLFSQDIRSQVQEEIDLQYAQLPRSLRGAKVFTEISRRWKDLDGEKKSKYETESLILKEKRDFEISQLGLGDEIQKKNMSAFEIFVLEAEGNLEEKYELRRQKQEEVEEFRERAEKIRKENPVEKSEIEVLKRPPSAYHLYCRQKAVSVVAGRDLWQELSDKEKQPYRDEAESLKEDYLKMKKENFVEKSETEEKPKKPMQPWFAYALSKRTKDFKLVDAMREGRKEYDSLPEETKLPFQEQFEKDKLIYDEKIEIYNRTYGLERVEKKRSYKSSFEIFVRDRYKFKVTYFDAKQKLLLEWNLLSDEEKRPYEDEYQEYLEKEEEGLKGFSPDGEIPGELWVGTANGQILKRNVQEISVQRMRTRGCRVMKVQEGDCIVAAARQYRIRVNDAMLEMVEKAEPVVETADENLLLQKN